MQQKMIMMSYFCGMVDLRLAESRISIRDHLILPFVISLHAEVKINLGLLKQKSMMVPLHYDAMSKSFRKFIPLKVQFHYNFHCNFLSHL